MENQLTEQIKVAKYFSLQLDECGDNANMIIIQNMHANITEV